VNKDELKRKVCEAIDRRRDEVIAFGEELFHTAELGYKETNTAKRIAEKLAGLGLVVTEGLALTGVKARLKGNREGPTVGVIGELDALLCPDHPRAHPQTGAAHVCGHHAQLAQVFGVAIGLVGGEVMEELGGDVALFAVPAEEYVEIEYRLDLKEKGEIEFLGGKQELVRLGEFNDIDLVISTHLKAHSEEELPLKKAIAGGTGNGFVAKKVRFLGRSAHAASPHLGTNALSAASVALVAIAEQVKTFKDEDCIRVHPIITKGGGLVNIIPSEVVLETYVRGKTLEAIKEANEKVDRALKAGAMALGAEVEIVDYPGYLPIRKNENLPKLFVENMGKLIGEENARYEEEHGAASSDFGDLSHLMPTMQASVSGAKGTGHSPDYEIADPVMAYVDSSKALAMTVVDLLHGKAELAKRVLKDFKPDCTKEEYLELMRSFVKKESYGF